MRWDEGHRSDDVVDKRGEGGGRRAGGSGLLGLLPLLLRTRNPVVIVLGIAAIFLFGGGLKGLLGGGDTQQAAERPSAGAVAPGSAADKQGRFVGFVLDDAQKVFRAKFSADGKSYENAKLVLFTNGTDTGCGFGESATGPFYCPADQRVYIDLGFFDELERRFRAAGDFAQAYVIAHEVGHHAQTLLGTSDRVHRAPKAQQKGDGGLSVRLELQADCYAGVWAHETQKRNLLEGTDVEEALSAATAIGDDRLQKAATGRVSPESWSHGSSEQRARWFKRGMTEGSLGACDTFQAAKL